METKKSNNMTILMGLFIIALIVGLVGIILVITNLVSTPYSTEAKINEITPTTEPSTKVEIVKNDEGDVQIQAITPPKGTETEQIYNYEFAVKGQEKITGQNIGAIVAKSARTVPSPYTTDLVRIEVPVLEIDVPIIKGVDGEKAIDQGWWLYPPSKERGEKIYLAHRRYWGKDHPYSAWDINTLKTGQKIILYDKDGKAVTYKIRSQAIRDGVDLSIFKPSDEDIVKIITCSTWNGDPGSADYRYITIAERAN